MSNPPTRDLYGTKWASPCISHPYVKKWVTRPTRDQYVTKWASPCIPHPHVTKWVTRPTRDLYVTKWASPYLKKAKIVSSTKINVLSSEMIINKPFLSYQNHSNTNQR